MFRVYHLQNFKYFLTREEERPENKWIEKYPIVTVKKFTGDYNSLRTKLHYEHGIENVRSDEDYIDNLNLCFVDEYNYNSKLDDYISFLEQDCNKCGYWGHSENNCKEQEDIMGYTIFENLEFEDELPVDNEEFEEEHEEEYVSWRKFR